MSRTCEKKIMCRLVGALILVTLSMAPPTVWAGNDAEGDGMPLKWADRRPVGRWFISNYQQTTKKNPGGYLSRKHDLVTKEGRRQFREALKAEVDNCIEIIRENEGQGVIIWDVCGARERGMMYVGDPRKLPEYSPHFNKLADLMFERFQAAGIKTGVTIRPIYVRPNKPSGRDKYGYWGYELYKQGEDDAVQELSDRIAYARERWGCSIFYLDSNIIQVKKNGEYRRTRMPASMIRRLHENHPDVLIIPEHEQPGYYPFSAPYSRHGTPAKARKQWPRAFSFIPPPRSPGDISTYVKRWDKLVQKVAAGDVVLFDAWWTSARNRIPRGVYQEVRYRRGREGKTADLDVNELITMLNSTEADVRFNAACTLAEKHPGEAIKKLREIATNEKEKVAIRKVAIDALGGSGDPAVGEALANILRKRGRGPLGYSAALVLSQLDDTDLNPPAEVKEVASLPGGVQKLCELAVLDGKTNERKVSEVAAWGLGQSDHEKAAKRLIDLLDSPQWRIRRAALQALGDNAHSVIEDPLKQFLEQDVDTRRDWREKALALKALGRVGNPELESYIKSFLPKHRDYPRGVGRRMRRAARDALNALKEQ